MEAQLQGSNECITLGIIPLTIGRAPDNLLRVEDNKSSSHHAVIRQDGTIYTITDLKSTNGTFLNEMRLIPNEAQPLTANDSIRIGDTRFTYLVIGEPEVAATERAMPPTIGELSSPQYNPSTPPPTEYAAPYTPLPTEYASLMPQETEYASPEYASPMPQGAEYAPITPPPTEYAPPPFNNGSINGMIPPPPPVNPMYPNYMNNNQGGLNNFSNYAPPIQNQRKKTPWLAIGAGILLIALIGAGIFAYMGGGNTNKDNGNNATPTTNSTSQATGKQNNNTTNTGNTGNTGSNTGNTGSNTGNTSQAGKVPNPYDPQMSNLVMNDTLSGPGNGWDASTGCVFTQNSLTVASGNGTAEICTNDQNLTNFTYALDVAMDSQTCGGMQFRLTQNSAGYNGYSFEICPDGSYIIGLVAASQIQSSSYLATNIKSQGNEIAVVAQGTTLTFFINGTQEKTIVDSTYSEGAIAVLSDAGDNTGEAAFANARVWTA